MQQWLHNQRTSAKEKFSSFSLPKENEEPWRYTDLKAMKMPAMELPKGQISVKMNNAFSLKEAISSGMISENNFLFQQNDKIDAMNTASWEDGFFIKVPKISSQS